MHEVEHLLLGSRVPVLLGLGDVFERLDGIPQVVEDIGFEQFIRLDHNSIGMDGRHLLSWATVVANTDGSQCHYFKTAVTDDGS